MSATFFEQVRAGVARANARVSTPVVFLDVGATEVRDAEAGTVTVSGGEAVTVQAFPPGLADRRSIDAGFASEGETMLPVRAEALVRSGGAAFEPAIGGRLTAQGSTWVISRISVMRDDAGAPIVFFLILVK